MISIDAGEYIFIPLTLGALLQAPLQEPEEEQETFIEYAGEEIWHPNYKGTIEDIFRKIDLFLD